MIKRTVMLLGLWCVAFAPQALAQLFNEDFSYPVGDSLINHGWSVTSSTVNPIKVTTPGLTYTGYVSSAIGNAATLVNTGQDLNRAFADSVKTGSVYFAFLAKVDTARTGDYFFHLIQGPATSNVFTPKIFVRAATNGSLAFGIAKRANTPNLSDSVYSLGVTYLLVGKYTFIPGSTTNDQVSLFVFADPALPATEPATPTIGPITEVSGTDATSLGLVGLRQGTAASAPNVEIDGIRVGTTWAGALLNQPVSAFSANAAAFGNVNVNTTAKDTVTVYNVGAAALTISGVSSSDATFTVAPLNGTIAPLDSMKFTVTFAPVALGPKSSMIVFTSNTSAGLDTVEATGTGVQPGFSAHPTTLAFGQVFQDSMKTDTITVINAGSTGSLVIDSVVSSNQVFTVSPMTGTVPASDSAAFLVTFHPVAAGAQSGTLVFFSNAPSAHDTAKVSGTGVLRAPALSSTPATLAFSGVLLGQSRKDSIVVKNTGFDSLFIASVTPSDTQFTVTPSQARLDTGASLKFYVTYRPARAAAVTAYLQFADNTAKALDSVKVTGTGGQSVITIAAARIDANHDYQPDLLGQSVTVIGVINSVSVQSTNLAYFMQDTTGGIELFQFGLTGAPVLHPGYRIRATGTIAIFRGTTELEPANLATDIVVLDTGNAVTSIPLTIGQYKADPERYESMRIKLAVAEPLGFTSAQWPAAGANGNLTIWDGKDTLALFLDLDTEIPGSAYPHFPVSLYGIASQFTSSASVYNDGYEITPMFNSDFVPINTPPLANFHLVNPLNASSVRLNDTAQVVSFNWAPAVDFNGDTLTYTFVPLGFSPMPSNGNGKSASLDLKGRQMLTYLGAADSVSLRWTVQASDGVNPAVTSVDTFRLGVVRGTITGIGNEQGIPKVYALDQNYPNPFNPTTAIHYALPQASSVSIKIYSVLGQEVMTLVDDVEPAGYRTVVWQGKNSAGGQVASGIYFYRITAQGTGQAGSVFTQVKKMIMLK